MSHVIARWPLKWLAAALLLALLSGALIGCGRDQAADERTARSSIGQVPPGGPPPPPFGKPQTGAVAPPHR